MKKTPNLLGIRFGRLVVIAYAGALKGKTIWKCKCDCGKEHIVRANCLLKSVGKGSTRSCGCLKVDSRSLPLGESLFNNVFRSYRGHAYERNLVFELTREQFKALTQSNCHYCGARPNSVVRYKDNNFFVYNGVDRKDNGSGYTVTNSVPCCKVCNSAKSDRGYEEFLAWIGRVYEHSIPR